MFMQLREPMHECKCKDGEVAYYNMPRKRLSMTDQKSQSFIKLRLKDRSQYNTL